MKNSLPSNENPRLSLESGISGYFPEREGVEVIFARILRGVAKWLFLGGLRFSHRFLVLIP
jgi:hypothetical protein